MGGCGDEYGLGSTLRVRHAEELAVVAVILLLPHAHELGQHFGHHLAGEVGIVDAEAPLLGGRRAPAGAELEAPLGKVVEHGHPLGDTRRVVDGRRDVEDARADVDVGRLGRHEGQERLGGREMRVVGQEVVLGGPGVLEPGLVGRHDEGHFVHDAVVLGRRRRAEHGILGRRQAALKIPNSMGEHVLPYGAADKPAAHFQRR